MKMGHIRREVSSTAAGDTLRPHQGRLTAYGTGVLSEHEISRDEADTAAPSTRAIRQPTGRFRPPTK